MGQRRVFQESRVKNKVGNVLELIPLGGVGEFGMNCMAVRYDDEMIVIDAGMGFPEESVYGVDVSVPDFDFLEEYRDNISAIVLTHGHEDHLGALPYILKKFNVPVYASHFTAGLADRKLEEHDLLGDTLIHRVEPRQVVEIGPFTVEFIRASHSLVDCFSLAIRTPVGTIVHTGDYKVDETPVIGEPIDLRTLRSYGQEGVLALLSDSTNATVPGRTPSERAVIPAFEEIFAESTGRIIPGNERAISRLIGNIYKRGANIIEEKRRLIHVSGHASQEDIKILTEAVRPKFVVPIHGEYRMLFRHKEFVKNHLGYAEENIILIENGDVLELDGERAAVIDKREIGRTFIDESGFKEVDSETVRERKQLAYEGAVTVVVTIDEETGELDDEPRIIARGVRGLSNGNGFGAGQENLMEDAK